MRVDGDRVDVLERPELFDGALAQSDAGNVVAITRHASGQGADHACEVPAPGSVGVDKEREALGCKLGAELEDLVERAERASPPRGADDRDDSVHGPLFVDALSFPAVWARYGESALARHSEVIPYWSRGLSGMSKMMANIRFSSCHGVKVLKSLDMLGSSQVTTLKSESIKARGFSPRVRVACNESG
jgi:hypothetical protein